MGNIKCDCASVDWQKFFIECERLNSEFRKPDQSDQVFQIALERAAQNYREMAVIFTEGEAEYSRLANLVHGMGVCGSSDLFNWSIGKMGIELTEREKTVIEVLSAIDWQVVK